MNATAQYRLARGIRLRLEPEGGGVLLVPEGLVTLSDSAAATLALVDGTRDVPAIVSALLAEFDADPGSLESDVRALLESFAERGFLSR